MVTFRILMKMNDRIYSIKILIGVSEINLFLLNAQKSPRQQGDTSLYTGCGLIPNEQTNSFDIKRSY